MGAVAGRTPRWGDPNLPARVEKPLDFRLRDFPDPGSAGITSYEPTEVVVEASCETACLLVLTDVDYPGWGAHVDGRQAEVIRVNGLFRGVLLAPGEHHVVYRFRSRSIARGAAISVATLLLVLAVGVGRRRRLRHST